MFWFGNPLWKLLKGPLEKALGDKFSLLSDRFKGLLSSTENDLIAVMKDRFSATGIYLHLTHADVGKREGKASIRFYLFPVEALQESASLRKALAGRLKNNVDLGAARNKAGVEDEDWDNMIEQYSGDVLRFGLPYAIKRIIDDKKEFAYGYYIIDLAKIEPIKVAKTDGYRDLVVLYQPPRDQPSLSQPKGVWAKRNDGAYEYKRDPNGYDDFKAN